jgi:hypothetical protein
MGTKRIQTVESCWKMLRLISCGGGGTWGSGAGPDGVSKACGDQLKSTRKVIPKSRNGMQ